MLKNTVNEYKKNWFQNFAMFNLYAPEKRHLLCTDCCDGPSNLYFCTNVNNFESGFQKGEL